MREKRARRTAEDARQAILEAAEKRLTAAGPSALRLQDVAADVGISHPAVLHHFGSREGLVRAVVEHATRKLQEDLLGSLLSAEGFAPDGVSLLDRAFETLAARGHARLIFWLLLSGYDPFDSDVLRQGFTGIVEATHALRIAEMPGKRKPTLEDTTFTVMLSALALFGEAVAGKTTFSLAGLAKDRGVDKRFRDWLAALLTRHLAEPPA